VTHNFRSGLKIGPREFFLAILVGLFASSAYPSIGVASDATYMELIEKLLEPEPKAISVGVPSGFGASGGLVFVSAAYTNQDPNTGLANDEDGSIAFGFGYGNPHAEGAVEIVVGITSVSTFAWGDGRFGDEGNLGLKFHRQVQGLPGAQAASLAFGVGNLVGWGSTQDLPKNTYLAFSQISDISAGASIIPVNLTLGWGSAISSVDRDPGWFASVGGGITPDLSVAIAWLGDEVQVGAVFFPRFMSDASAAITYADATHLNSDSGRIIVSVSYAFDRWMK
jgi:hypothetical protein